MTYNPEKSLLKLKEQLSKAEEVLNTPEYKQMEKEFNVRVEDAIKEEDETGVHSMILDVVSCEEQYVNELRWEISDLKYKLDHSPF